MVNYIIVASHCIKHDNGKCKILIKFGSNKRNASSMVGSQSEDNQDQHWAWDKINGLVQERRNSIANALKLRLSWTNPSKWSMHATETKRSSRWYLFVISWSPGCHFDSLHPDSKVHGANMGPIWGPRWAPCWPHKFCYLGSVASHEKVINMMTKIW